MDKGMRIITEARIREAKVKWPRAASALELWRMLIKRNSPSDYAALKQLSPALDKYKYKYKDKDKDIFDVGGNKLRIIATVQFKAQTVYIKHVLDHKEYDLGKWKD